MLVTKLNLRCVYYIKHKNKYLKKVFRVKLKYSAVFNLT